MFVMHATDIASCRNSIVEFLQEEADRYAKDADRARTVRDKGQSIARKNAILNALDMIKGAHFADLTKPLSEQ